jgi:hypothetical protein
MLSGSCDTPHDVCDVQSGLCTIGLGEKCCLLPFGEGARRTLTIRSPLVNPVYLRRDAGRHSTRCVCVSNISIVFSSLMRDIAMGRSQSGHVNRSVCAYRTDIGSVPRRIPPVPASTARESPWSRFRSEQGSPSCDASLELGAEHARRCSLRCAFPLVEIAQLGDAVVTRWYGAEGQLIGTIRQLNRRFNWGGWGDSACGSVPANRLLVLCSLV